ncbi:MAG: hypothetical protein WBF77_12795 [Sulfurimonadaceae bacterium]
MKKIVFISLLTSTLFAEQKHQLSDYFVEQDVKKITNESEYGKCNTYSLLFAKHQLATQEEDLHFFYGAKMGLVQEEFTSDNGFGIPLNKIGAYYAAAVGMEYDLSNRESLLAEGSRSEDHAHSRYESKLQLNYTYNF